MTALELLSAIHTFLASVNKYRESEILQEYSGLSMRNSLPGYLNKCVEVRGDMLLVGHTAMVNGRVWLDHCVTGLVCGGGDLGLQFKDYVMQWRNRPDSQRPQDFESWMVDVTAWYAHLKSMGFAKPSGGGGGGNRHGEPPKFSAAVAKGQRSKSCWTCGETGHFARSCPNGDGTKDGPKPGGSSKPGSGKKPWEGGQHKSLSVSAVRTCAALISGLHRDCVVVDTGSQAGHFLNSRLWFEDLEPFGVRVQFGSAAPSTVKSKGRARVLTNGGWLELNEAYYEPQLPYNILSTETLCDTTYLTWSKDAARDVITFTDSRDNSMAFTAPKDKGNSNLFLLHSLAEVRGGAARGGAGSA